MSKKCPVCKRKYQNNITAPRNKFTLYELDGYACFHTEAYTVEMDVYFHTEDSE